MINKMKNLMFEYWKESLIIQMFHNIDSLLPIYKEIYW